MLLTLIAKEIRELLGSTKFILTFSVCAFLILLSFYMGANNYLNSKSHYEAARAENLRQMEGVTDWLMIEQHRIFLPPQPLAALVTGVSNDIGRTTEMKARGELTAHDSQFNEEPIYAVFRFLDLEFIFQIVLSLFAILLGYDAISGEKERGTLKLALSNAIPRPLFILGKLLGSFISLSISIAIAIILGCILLPVLGVPMSAGDWSRLSLIILTGLLYFGAFLTISIFVSSLTARSSNSFLLLLVIWVMSVMIVPRASVLLAGRAIAVPSVDEVAAQKASFASELWSDFRQAMADFRAPDSDPDNIEATLNAFNTYVDSLTSIRDGKMDVLAGRLNEERYNKQRERQRVAFGLARISPAASLSLATSELAGTSLSLKDTYLSDAKNYQKTYADFMKEKTGMNVGGRMIVFKASIDGEENVEEPIDPTEMPAFVYDRPPFPQALAAAIPDMGILALFNLVFFAGAFVSFNRYDAR